MDKGGKSSPFNGKISKTCGIFSFIGVKIPPFGFTLKVVANATIFEINIHHLLREGVPGCGRTLFGQKTGLNYLRGGEKCHSA